jgi:ESS family glutamate:Na+ symporter
MLVILAAQVAVVAVFTTFVTFRLMGSDYDAAVMASGHCGFAHGATPSAIANMDSVTHKFGPAHRAFIVVPMVGGMFIDITNSLNITWFINMFHSP